MVKIFKVAAENTGEKESQNENSDELSEQINLDGLFTYRNSVDTTYIRNLLGLNRLKRIKFSDDEFLRQVSLLNSIEPLTEEELRKLKVKINPDRLQVYKAKCFKHDVGYFVGIGCTHPDHKPPKERLNKDIDIFRDKPCDR